MTPQVDCIILAAGLSRRMGSNKLLLPFRPPHSKTLLECFLNKLPFKLFKTVHIIVSDEKVADIAKRFPVSIHYNKMPTIGKSSSIAIGLEHCSARDGFLFCVADQPNIQTATIMNLIETFNKQPEKIIIPRVNGNSQNPVLFPIKYKEELLQLTGDDGGKIIIQKNTQDIYYIDYPSIQEFQDIDNQQDYKKHLNVNNT